jgi:small subunit ribosomal protein S2
MIKIPKTEELFEAAVHVGHGVGHLHPKMKPYTHSLKHNVHWIDLDKTRECLQKAVDFVKEVAAKNGKILFVGTKAAAQAIIKKYAEQAGMPYVSERWLGGTITNFSTINSLIKKLKKMEEDRDKGEWKKYTKKEQLDMSRQLEKLNLYVGGMRNLEKLPDAMYIVDLIEEKTAVNEARRAKIKTVGLCDVNTNPTFVTYPIPANDDAIKSIELITSLIAEAATSKK